MNYKYPPVYKYIILLIVITSFLRYYKVVTKENFLVIAGIFTYMTFVFDYVVIRNHPTLFTEGHELEKNNEICKNEKKKYKRYKKSKKKILEKFEEDEEPVDSETLDEKFEKDMKEFENQIKDETDSDNLTEEIQKELDELDLE